MPLGYVIYRAKTDEEKKDIPDQCAYDPTTGTWDHNQVAVWREVSDVCLDRIIGEWGGRRAPASWRRL